MKDSIRHSSTSPNPWQAIFKNQRTRVRLVGGRKHRFRVEPMAAPDVFWDAKEPAADGSRIVVLEGTGAGDLGLSNATGHVTLVAFDPALTNPKPSEARLDIDVLENDTKTVRFYRLIDSANHQSKRTLASMRQVLFDAAVIHSLQNGVFLGFQGTQDLILNVDLGPILFSAEKGFTHLQQLFDSGGLDPCRADFHVFLVWSVESDEKDVHSGRQQTLATTLRNMCLFEDFNMSAAPGPGARGGSLSAGIVVWDPTAMPRSCDRKSRSSAIPLHFRISFSRSPLAACRTWNESRNLKHENPRKNG